ncbi:MAG: hypothetical protein ABSF44_04560 [Candidatus Bathyarchaeia archaeon]
MEITEKERLMLLEYKKHICDATMELIELSHDLGKNELEIKKKISLVLSSLSKIASYSEIKNCNLDGFREIANEIFEDFIHPSREFELLREIDSSLWEKEINLKLELFCNYANFIRFDFANNKAIKINFPKNLNLGYITNR